uniref:ANK_REP_REGION domain-containing protein n=1 Tax=Macrostomum lignano TaxID=282301 RepID=A0A1I8FCQ7_9PLAT
ALAANHGPTCRCERAERAETSRESKLCRRNYNKKLNSSCRQKNAWKKEQSGVRRSSPAQIRPANGIGDKNYATGTAGAGPGRCTERAHCQHRHVKRRADSARSSGSSLIETAARLTPSVLPVKQALNSVSAEAVLLEHRFQEPVGLKRPSTGRQLRVLRPKRADAAAAGWASTLKTKSSAAEQYGGVTALMLATIAEAASRSLRVLIDCGADLNASNSLGRHAHLPGLPRGHVTAAELLIRSGAYLNLPNASGITPLMIACFHRRRGPSSSCCCATELAWIVATWPARRPLTTAARPAPWTACACWWRAGAAYQGASDQLLDLLLSAAPESALAARDCRDRGALFYAIEGGQPADRLLRAGASTRAAQPSGVTLLMTAALRYRRRLAELLVDLLRNEADRDDEDSDGIRARDAEGRNALFYCVANPEPDLLQLLLDSGLPAEKATDAPHCSWPASPAATGLWWTSCCAALTRWPAGGPGRRRLGRRERLDPGCVRAQNQQLLHQLIGMGGAAVTDGRIFPSDGAACCSWPASAGNAEAAMLFAEMAKPDDLTVAVRGGDADGEGEGEGEGR